MSKIYSIHIENFRCIHELNQTFGNKSFIALIGRGDSGKSTVLKAISLVLNPNWNVNISDLDFFNADTSNNIVIEAVITDIPDDLLRIDKYGLFINLLNGDEVVTDIEDVDADQKQPVLRIRLTVDESLEPKWTICSGREIGDVQISASDRAKLNMFMVSDYIDNHFSYSKGSPLYSWFKQNISNENSPDKKLIEVVRQSYNAIKTANTFAEFDNATNRILKTAQQLGLTISELRTLLEFKDNAYTESNISLHSGEIPYRLQGKGSKRLLSIAIQQSLIKVGGIILIDEIEQGLESDRARNLTRLLARSGNGQIFITTHSRDVILEPDASSVYLMRSGVDKLINFDIDLQGTLRAKPEAFFAKRIISCEGATEEGIIRAFSDNLQIKRGYGISAQGIVHIDGSGSNKFFKYARRFKAVGIEVMVFCDNDNTDVDDDREDAIADGIKVVMCEKGNSIEQQIFRDMPWDGICELLYYAIEEHGDEAILINNGFEKFESIICASQEEQTLWRAKLGDKAKSKQAWFKNIHHGEFLGQIWLKYLEQMDSDCTLKKEYNEILEWIGDDIN